jgi:ribosomal small subunit protein bTHX
MGKGDKKSKKGKRYKGTYGVTRSKNAIKSRLKRVASKKTSATETPAKAKRTVSRKKAEA